MSLFRLQSLIVIAWFAVMLVVIGVSLATNAAVSGAGLAGWVLLGCIPPVVMLKIFRGPGPNTMSQVIAGARRSRVTGSRSAASTPDVLER